MSVTWGIDPVPARALARSVEQWAVDVEPVVTLVLEAEGRCDLTTSTTPELIELGRRGGELAATIDGAVDDLEGFRIDPFAAFAGVTSMVGSALLAQAGPGDDAMLVVDARLALILDLPIGRLVDAATAAEAQASGETYRQTQIRHELASLDMLPWWLQQYGYIDRIVELEAEYEEIDPAQRGDLGGTFEVEVRDRFSTDATSDVDLGLAAITGALADTGDGSQIQVDEFGMVLHDNGKVTLVLPGVIDLSSPAWGYDDETRSVRDLDQEAVRSSLSTSVTDNGYATLVYEFIERQIASGPSREVRRC